MGDVAQVVAPAEGGQNLSQDHGQNPPNVAEFSEPLMARPEWVPEKFFTKENKINFREMAKSYGELEKVKSAPAKDGQSNAPAADKTKVPDSPAPVVQTIPGVASDRVAFFSNEMTTAGKLSETSYTELAALGYPKDVVDVYVAGLTKDASVSQAVSEARIADKEIASIKADIGGDAALVAMIKWSQTNLSDADRKVYNDAVSSTDPAKVRMAVNGLHHAFTQAHGKEPNYLEVGGHGVPPGAGGITPYGSEAEVTKDMGTREYREDPAFRDKVAKRLSVSGNVFTRSRDMSTVVR